ncbi:caspase-7-like isoform X2 [Lissotriton helveticus]
MDSPLNKMETSEADDVPNMEGGDTTDAIPDWFPKIPFITNKKKAKEHSPASSTNIQQRVNAHPHLYNMNYKHVGRCVIINNENFQKSSGISTSSGTNKDAKEIERCFQNLGFEVSVKNDQTCDQMKAFLKQVADEKHSDNACFVCVLLSHGEEGYIYGTDGMIEIKELTSLFRGDRCRTLVGKPKLFFIQACRGKHLDTGLEADAASGSDSDDEGTSPKNKIPVEADFLLAYSTVEGYYAGRNGERGSWFIQSLCKVITEHGRQLEILQILTRVNFMVAAEFESEHADPDLKRNKQVPCITSMLTNELYFKT